MPLGLLRRRASDVHERSGMVRDELGCVESRK